MNQKLNDWITQYNVAANAKYQISNINLFARKLRIICEYLHNSQSPFGFVSIHSKDLKLLLGKNRGNNYQRVIQCAHSLKLIRIERGYRVGHHTRRYKLLKDWESILNNQQELSLQQGTKYLLKMVKSYRDNESKESYVLSRKTLEFLLGISYFSTMVELHKRNVVCFEMERKGFHRIKLKAVENAAITLTGKQSSEIIHLPALRGIRSLVVWKNAV